MPPSPPPPRLYSFGDDWSPFRPLPGNKIMTIPSGLNLRWYFVSLRGYFVTLRGYFMILRGYFVSLRESSWVFLRPTVVMNGLIISFSAAVNGAQNFLTLVYFLCSVCMLLNSQMAEINGNYIFPKFKSDFFIVLIFFYKGMVCEPEFFKAINSRTSLTE